MLKVLRSARANKEGLGYAKKSFWLRRCRIRLLLELKYILTMQERCAALTVTKY